MGTWLFACCAPFVNGFLGRSLLRGNTLKRSFHALLEKLSARVHKLEVVVPPGAEFMIHAARDVFELHMPSLESPGIT